MGFQTTESYALIPAGEHVLTLTAIERKRIPSQFAKDEDGKIAKVLWSFKSGDRSPHEYGHFTGETYGNSAAALTKFLDQIVPGVTAEAARTMDEYELIGSKYRAIIRHTKAEKEGDKRYAELALIEPYSPRKRAIADEDAE